ncbi:MAG: septum formation protein Maf [Bacteroidales bacterium]|nr:septum formation protein Maf [Bacteroidales bacterium]
MSLPEQINNWDIILASQSPRRRQLLEGMGLIFRVQPFDVDETIPFGVSPVQASEMLAEQKALAFPADEITPRTLLIAADTLVVLNDLILGKPESSGEAVRMLQLLSGHTHEVITGVCLRSLQRIRTFHALSRVTFRQLSEEDIQYYVEHYTPYDKAGAYGIQEWIGYVGVERIEGSYFNVMGLPTQTLWTELQAFIAGQA